MMNKDDSLAKELKQLYIGITIILFIINASVFKLYCYVFNIELSSILGILICVWLSLWYVCIVIVYTHLFCFIEVISELAIKEDLRLLIVLISIYILPPIYFLNVLESHKVSIRLDHLINEFIG